MSTSRDGRPFTRRVDALRKQGLRYGDLATKSNDARSSAWFNNLINRGAGAVGAPSGEQTINGLASLMDVSAQDVRAMIAEEWHGVRIADVSDRVRGLAARIDALKPEDAELLESLIQRLQPPPTLDFGIPQMEKLALP